MSTNPVRMLTYRAEYTDTFGGEANYAWVRRVEWRAPDTASNRALIRRAKRELGIGGRHRVEDFGDCLAIYPRNTCTVLFIDYSEYE